MISDCVVMSDDLVTSWTCVLINRMPDQQETLVIIWRPIYASTLPWKKHRVISKIYVVCLYRLLYLNQFYLEINIFCWDRTSQNHLLTSLFEREVQGYILVNVCQYLSLFTCDFWPLQNYLLSFAYIIV